MEYFIIVVLSVIAGGVVSIGLNLAVININIMKISDANLEKLEEIRINQIDIETEIKTVGMIIKTKDGR